MFAVLTDRSRFRAKTVTPQHPGVQYARCWSSITTRPRIRCVGSTKKFDVLNAMRSRSSPMSGRIARIATQTFTCGNLAPIARSVTRLPAGKFPSTRSRNTRTGFHCWERTPRCNATIATRVPRLVNFRAYPHNACLAICLTTKRLTIRRTQPTPRYLASPAIRAIRSTAG